MSWLRVLRHGLLLGREDFRVFWSSWRVWLMTHILRVTTSAAMWVLLGRLLDSQDLVHYLLVGQIVIAGPQQAGWAVAAFTWDRMFIGTYPMLVAAPMSLVPAFMGRTSIWLLNGIATSLMMLIVLVPLFGLRLSPAAVVGIPAIIALVCASSYALAFCIGTLINWAPRLRNVAHNTASLIMAAICGVVVPVTFWPGWVESVAKVLPVTHGLKSIRLLVAGAPVAEIAVGAALEALVGLCWLSLGIVTLDRTVNVARRTGAIDIL